MLRDIDNTLILGYGEQLDQCMSDCSERGFQIIEARRGTRREQRLLLLTLDELGLQGSYGPDYFDADMRLIRHLSQLSRSVICARSSTKSSLINKSDCSKKTALQSNTFASDRLRTRA